MKNQNTQPQELDNDPGERVAAYLVEHPEFFETHPELLSELRLPHPGGTGTVSLVERQIAALRSEASRYRKQLEDLISVARENEVLNQRLHRLTLRLLDVGTLSDTLTSLQDGLYEEFQVDAVELRLFSGEDFSETAPGGGRPALDAFQEFLGQGRPVCGRLKHEQMDSLFGAQAEELASAAIIPLHAKGVIGILAIGSRSASRFHPGKGTEFLVRLGDIVSCRLQLAELPGV